MPPNGSNVTRMGFVMGKISGTCILLIERMVKPQFRCPICGSTNVECEADQVSHRHECLDCGKVDIWAPVRINPRKLN